MNVVIDPRRTAEPVLNVILPEVNERGVSGGPNTAYLLGCLLAKAGIPIRYVCHDKPLDGSLGRLKQHIRRLTGLDPDAQPDADVGMGSGQERFD